MSEEMYQVIADEKELEWFFNHAIFKPLSYESYSMVFVSRHKKLTKEEQENFGLTRKESEFIAVQTIRAPKFSHVNEPERPFAFDNFLQHVKRFNVDKGAYTTGNGQPLPEKTIAVIMYINPCDDIKVADEVIRTIEDAKTGITKAAAAGKNNWGDVAPMYQVFGNLDNSIKHMKACCKGSSYWMDYDIDVPAWFKYAGVENAIAFQEYMKNASDSSYYEKWLELNPLICNYYYNLMLDVFNKAFGKGNYIVVDTSGGYHILVRTYAIKADPHLICEKVDVIYNQGIADGYELYVDEKGINKFECNINNSQIPGLPLPGTYQYGRPVTVINKEDFE